MKSSSLILAIFNRNLTTHQYVYIWRHLRVFETLLIDLVALLLRGIVRYVHVLV